jgi:hypothetical protein
MYDADIDHCSTIEGTERAWEMITRSDIERATQDLTFRRAQMLARHAEEVKNLDDERDEIEALTRMVAAFTEKFKKQATAAHEVLKNQKDGNEKTGDVPVVPGISLFVTQSQKAKLREMGVNDQQIREMKPAEAHRILGLTR